MKRNMLSLVMMLVIASGILFAAGQSDDSGGSESVQEPITLTYLTTVIEYPKYEQEINAVLHKTHPNINVEIEHIADNYEAVLKTKIASGNPPDIFAWQGYLAKEPFVQAEQVIDLSNDGFQDLIYSNFLESGMSDGKLYGIPTTVQTSGLLYNKDAFKEAGIAEPPRTVTELKSAIEKLNNAGITPFTSALKEQWVNYQWFWYAQSPFISDMKQWYDDMFAGTGTFRNDRTDAMFELYDLIYANSTANPLSTDFSTMCYQLGTGEAAMAIQGEWSSVMALKVNPDANLGMTGLPLSEDPDEATILSDVAEVLYVSSGSKNQEAAKAFLKFMLSKEGAEVTCGIRQTGSPSTANPEIDLNPFAKDGNQWILDGKKTAIYGWNYWAPGIQDIVGKNLQGYFSGSFTVDEFITDLDNQWKMIAGN